MNLIISLIKYIIKEKRAAEKHKIKMKKEKAELAYLEAKAKAKEWEIYK